VSWTTDSFMERLCRETKDTRIAGLKDISHKGASREELKERVQGLLGRLPDRLHPLQAVTLETADYGEYLLEKVSYSTMESVNVPVLVLVPKGKPGPWPAVVACHGHGNGQWDAAGMTPDGVQLPGPGIHNQFAVELVKRGLLVVIAEIMGFGVRRPAEELRTNPGYSSCASLSSNLLLHGQTLAGIRIYEAMRALDYLESRKDVAAERIGMFGFSGGGLISAYTASLDERVKATVLTGYACTFEASIMAMHHCICNYVPGILGLVEEPELIGLIAPRHLFVEAGEADPIFPAAGVREAVDRIAQTYASQNAQEHFQWEVFPGAHQIWGRSSFSWLAERLGADKTQTS
jgi:dienelactone hydrolase